MSQAMFVRLGQFISGRLQKIKRKPPRKMPRRLSGKQKLGLLAGVPPAEERWQQGEQARATDTQDWEQSGHLRHRHGDGSNVVHL